MDSEAIKNAIDRSREYGEIVRCEVSDSSSMEAMLTPYECEFLEHINWTEDNRGILDACGLAAVLALHLRNHLIVKKRIIVAASRFLMLAMLARKHRVKVASVLACDCLNLHRSIPC